MLQAVLWSGSLLSQVLGDIMLEIQSLLYYGVVFGPKPVPRRQVRLELAGDRIQGVERLAAGRSRPSRAVLIGCCSSEGTC